VCWGFWAGLSFDKGLCSCIGFCGQGYCYEGAHLRPTRGRPFVWLVLTGGEFISERAVWQARGGIGGRLPDWREEISALPAAWISGWRMVYVFVRL